MEWSCGVKFWSGKNSYYTCFCKLCIHSFVSNEACPGIFVNKERSQYISREQRPNFKANKDNIDE